MGDNIEDLLPGLAPSPPLALFGNFLSDLSDDEFDDSSSESSITFWKDLGEGSGLRKGGKWDEDGDGFEGEEEGMEEGGGVGGEGNWMTGVGAVFCLFIGFQVILLTSGFHFLFETVKLVCEQLLKVEEDAAMGRATDWIVAGGRGKKGGGGGEGRRGSEAEDLLRRRRAHLRRLEEINREWKVKYKGEGVVKRGDGRRVSF